MGDEAGEGEAEKEIGDEWKEEHREKDIMLFLLLLIKSCSR